MAHVAQFLMLQNEFFPQKGVIILPLDQKIYIPGGASAGIYMLFAFLAFILCLFYVFFCVPFSEGPCFVPLPDL